MVSLDPRYLKAVGVDRRRIKAFAGLAGPYYFPKLAGPVLTQAFGEPKGQTYQAINFASAQAPAAFLAAGDRDRVVVPINTEKMGQTLSAKGVDTEWHIYPGQTHASVLLGLSRPRRARSPVYDDMIHFLKRQVGLPRHRPLAAR
jgi:acetyl esterase/lipase